MRHVDADDVPVLERPHLHEVAELVREPEPPPARLVEHRLAPAGERRVDSAPVLDLEEEEAAVVPGANDSEASAVADAVRRDLVHGEDERVRRLAVEPGFLGSVGDEVPHLAERVGVEGEPSGRRRRVVERVREGRRDRFEPAVAAAFPEGLHVGHERMRPLGLLDHARIESRHVVRAEEPERRGVREREVEERLVAVALRELRVAAPGPDRLADPADRRPPAPCSSTNSCQAAMMRAGFAPTSAMSAKSTRSASSPSASRSRAIFSAFRTTKTGSPASIPSRMNWSIPRRNSSGPR